MARYKFWANSRKEIVKKKGILIGISAFLFIFVLGTGLALAQTWKEPSTKPPGDPKSANIPDLLRIKSDSGKQVKEGKLRIGSAKSSDIFSTLEVFGNLQVQNNLLVDVSGTCQDPVCLYDGSNEKTPLFLVQSQGPNKFIGIGTNKYSAPLTVHAGPNEYLNGAIYATSSTDHAVKGVSTAGTVSGIGIFSSSIAENIYGIFGKSVDIAHDGIIGTTATAAPAALFKGNVIVSGGFLQGDGSQLYGASNVNDASFEVATGARGLSVWATTNPAVHTIAASGDTLIDLGLTAGQRVRSINIMIKKSTEGVFRMFPSAYSSAVTVALEAPGRLKFTNTSADEYQVRITAHIETGVSIALSYKLPGAEESKPLANPQTLLYEGSQLIELSAVAQGGTSQNFKWEFLVPSTGGQLCDIQAGNPANCNEDAHTGAAVFYKQSGSYADNTPSDVLQVTWQVGAGVTEQFILNFVDIQTPSNPAIEFNAGTGAASPAIIPVRVVVPSGASTPFVSFCFTSCKNPATPRGSAAFLAPNPVSLDGSGFANGTYKAPNIELDAIDTPQENIAVSIFGFPDVEKTFTAYLVPNMSVVTYFDTIEPGPYFGKPESERLSSTVAAGLDLQTRATLTGVASPYPTTVNCSGCTAPSGTNFVFNSATQGAHVLTFTWTPDATPPTPEMAWYPNGFNYSTSTTLYVGSITTLGAISVTQNVNVTTPFTLNGYPDPRFLATTPTNVSNLTFTTSGTNPNLACSSSGVTGNISTSGSNQTLIDFSTSSCATYTVRGRSNYDLRQTVDRAISVTGCGTGGCTGCSGPKPPACCNIGGGS